jgi:hypothetical protein
MSALPGRPIREGIYSLGVEPRQIPDPGDAGAIQINQIGYVRLVTTGAETRTLADPSFIGQVMDLFFDTDGGDCVITAASPINQNGDTIMTFSDVGEHIQRASSPTTALP